MTQRPRILVIGGAAKSLINFRGPLLESLVAAGYTVTACSPDATEEIKAQLRDLGVAHRHVPMSRAGLNPIRDVSTLISIAKIIREYQPTHVLSYTAKPIIYGGLASTVAKNAQFFAMITGLGYGFGAESQRQRLVGKAIRSLYKVALKRAAGVVFQNPDDLAEFRNAKLINGSGSVSVVNGSGVDLSLFERAPLPEAPLTFLLVARLLIDKGVREYVAAARFVKQKHPNVRFLLVGNLDANPNSIREGELSEWVSEGVVEYLGKLDDVRPAYSQCSVYVLPSYREGMPRTVLEAMAVGRPVITTDVPGCRETVRDGKNGFIVPPRDVPALQRAMLRFEREPQLLPDMAEQSRIIAETRFDANLVSQQMLAAMQLRASLVSDRYSDV